MEQFTGGCFLVCLLFLGVVQSLPGAQQCYLQMQPSSGVISVMPRADVSFVCNASCLGPLSRGELVWKNQREKPVPNLGRFRIHSVGYNRWMLNRLVVRSAMPEDSGVYTCEVTHSGRSMRYSVTLHVQEDPSNSRRDDGPRRGDIYIEPEPDFGEIRPVRDASHRRHRHNQKKKTQPLWPPSSSSGSVKEQLSVPLPDGGGDIEGREKSTERTLETPAELGVGRQKHPRESRRVRRQVNTGSSDSPGDTTIGDSSSQSGMIIVSSLGMDTLTTESPLSSVSDGMPEKDTMSTDPASTSNSSEASLGYAGMGTSDTSILSDVTFHKDGSPTPFTSTKDGSTTPSLGNTTPRSPSSIPYSSSISTSVGPYSTSRQETASRSTTVITPTPTSKQRTTLNPDASGGGHGGGSGGGGGGHDSGSRPETGSSQDEDGESDFGRFGLLAFCLALAVIFLLLVILLLFFILPRYCQHRAVWNIFSSMGKDDPEAAPRQSSKQESNVILLGERPHKPLAPMTSATGLNGEFITPVDLDAKEGDGQDVMKKDEGDVVKKAAGGEATVSKPSESFVSTFLIGRLSSSKDDAATGQVVAGNTAALDDNVFAPASSTPIIEEKTEKTKTTKKKSDGDTSSSSSDDDESKPSSPDNSKDASLPFADDPNAGGLMSEIHLQIHPEQGVVVDKSQTDV